MHAPHEGMDRIRGVTTLTNDIPGQSQNCSGNLEISPVIGTLGNISGRRDNSGTLQRKGGTSEEILFHVSQKFGRMIQISRTT